MQFKTLAGLCTILSLISCGGGSSNSTSSTPNTSITYQVSTIAGTGTLAAFGLPGNVAVDNSGNVYVSDAWNNEIKIITPSGSISTMNGSNIINSIPNGIAVDNNGNVYEASLGSSQVFKISSSGVFNTIAGSVGCGNVNGNGSSAAFCLLRGLGLDNAGNIYLADNGNNEIRKISPNEVVSTLAGSPTAGNSDGAGTAALFHSPYGIAVDSTGNIYVADSLNYSIRKITPNGVVTTLAGSGSKGSEDGIGNAASFNQPQGIAVDSNDNLYVADCGNNEIRMITSSGTVSTIAGSVSPGNANGNGLSASFNCPEGIAVDKSGIIYVADVGNYEVRKIIAAP